MRLATFRDESGARVGVVRGEHLVDLATAATLAGSDAQAEHLRDMLSLIEGGPAALKAVEALVRGASERAQVPLTSVELLAPIPRPRKNVFCLGRNYADHAAESLRAAGKEVRLPSHPNIFTKAVTAVTGPYAEIPLDARVTEQLDWEVELAVVLGSGGRHIPRAEALGSVFGYTVANDLSAREVQHRPGMQWFLGKSLDASCPLGPWIVTADEVPDPQRLALRLTVNGTVKQEGTTAEMLFDVATIIEALSAVLTLEPGDIVLTGTPAGVGYARTPPEYLCAGDEIETTVEGIGTLRNRIVAVGQA